jgi:hypothetical protein
LPSDPKFSSGHPPNRKTVSSKGYITADQLPGSSALYALYNDPEFRKFLCAIFDIKMVYEYLDPSSSINLHYTYKGQELG